MCYACGMSWFIECPDCGSYLEPDFTCEGCGGKYEPVLHQRDVRPIIVNAQADDTTVVQAHDGD